MYGDRQTWRGDGEREWWEGGWGAQNTSTKAKGGIMVKIHRLEPSPSNTGNKFAWLERAGSNPLNYLLAAANIVEVSWAHSYTCSANLDRTMNGQSAKKTSGLFQTQHWVKRTSQRRCRAIWAFPSTHTHLEQNGTEQMPMSNTACTKLTRPAAAQIVNFSACCSAAAGFALSM